MHISGTLSGCPVVTSDRTHTGIIRRILLLHSRHVDKNKIWVKMSAKIYLCTIFWYTTNTGHRREHIFILRFHMNQIPVWASRLQSSSARFQSNCIDCSPLNIIHTRTHTLQTHSMYLTSESMVRNNSRISGSQQNYLVGKSGSPQISGSHMAQI